MITIYYMSDFNENAQFRKAGSKNRFRKLKQQSGLITGAVLGAGALVIGSKAAKRFAALNRAKSPTGYNSLEPKTINVSSRRIN